MENPVSTRKFTFTLQHEDALTSTLDEDILKLVDKKELPSNFHSRIPPLIPSYTLMKYMELAAMITGSYFLGREDISLGYYFDFKPFKKVAAGDEIIIVANLKKRTRKIFYYCIDVYHSGELVARANHNRFVTKPEMNVLEGKRQYEMGKKLRTDINNV